MKKADKCMEVNMKVNKAKFIESLNYIRDVNKCALKDLDLSEFTNSDLVNEKKEFELTGLNNKDFIVIMVMK
jgi:hypothetical protein